MKHLHYSNCVFIIIIIMILIKSIKSEIYKDCGSQTGSIISLEVTDCQMIPCKFTRGQNYTMNLQFKTNVNSNRVTNKVYGIISKLPVPFRLPQDDGCQLGIQCPITSNTHLQQSVTLPILNEYPKIGLVVEWKVMDDSSKMLVCFQFPVLLI